MKILVVGEPAHFEECSQKFSNHDVRHVGSAGDAAKALTDADVIFDFIIETKPQSFALYAPHSLTVFLNTSMITLASLVIQKNNFPQCTAFGFNGFPSLFNRQRLEVSVRLQDDIPVLEKICASLKTEFSVVDDRVGLVTPRVICMIINEAFYTVQEGTATREDIDLAMKLGTNYPYGPFEWCERIGVPNIYRLLEAVYADTKDERYKICPLLKKEYLQSKASNA